MYCKCEHKIENKQIVALFLYSVFGKTICKGSVCGRVGRVVASNILIRGWNQVIKLFIIVVEMVKIKKKRLAIAHF